MVAAVSGTSNTSQTNATSSTQQAKAATDAAAASLDYNSFLKLLLAQLKNQDPTKPMDSTEYMSQLASFSNVEQSIKMNNKLDAMLTNQQLSQAENLIGKTVVSNEDATVTGKVMSVKVTSDGAVATLDNGKTLSLANGVTVKA